jgi:hypothetical protein
MKLTVYIKKHLISDIIVLLATTGVIYLLVTTLNYQKLDTEPSVEMIPISDSSQEVFG